MSRFGLYWDPWRELEQLQGEMNRLFAPFREGAAVRGEFPAVNLWQNEGSLMLTAELPGYKIDEIDITATADSVTIRGERPREELSEGEAYRRQERPVGPFARTVELPLEIDPQKTEASYEKGVLTLKLQRPEEKMPRKIQVKAG